MQRSALIALVTMTALAWSCAPAEPEAPDTAATPAAEAVDATIADPDHYKVEVENDRVRIVRITYGPGEGSAMHYHPDHVAVFLTPLKGEFQMPDGTSQTVDAEAGSYIFVPAGRPSPP